MSSPISEQNEWNFGNNISEIPMLNRTLFSLQACCPHFADVFKKAMKMKSDDEKIEAGRKRVNTMVQGENR